MIPPTHLDRDSEIARAWAWRDRVLACEHRRQLPGARACLAPALCRRLGQVVQPAECRTCVGGDPPPEPGSGDLATLLACPSAIGTPPRFGRCDACRARGCARARREVDLAECRACVAGVGPPPPGTPPP